MDKNVSEPRSLQWDQLRSESEMAFALLLQGMPHLEAASLELSNAYLGFAYGSSILENYALLVKIPTFFELVFPSDALFCGTIQLWPSDLQLISL